MISKKLLVISSIFGFCAAAPAIAASYQYQPVYQQPAYQPQQQERRAPVYNDSDYSYAPRSRSTGQNQLNQPQRQAEPYYAPARKFYAGLKFMETFSSVSAKYKTDGIYASIPYSTDSYNLTHMGGAVSLGLHASESWRLEAELGYIGKASNETDGVDVSLSAPYLNANGLYNFQVGEKGGIYLGAGLGMAFVNSTIESALFYPGGESKSAASLMLAGMLGYQYRLDEALLLDIGYKLSTFSGPSHTRQFQISGVMHDFTADFGSFMNHSLSLGIRFEF